MNNARRGLLQPLHVQSLALDNSQRTHKETKREINKRRKEESSRNQTTGQISRQNKDKQTTQEGLGATSQFALLSDRQEIHPIPLGSDRTRSEAKRI